MKAVLFLLVSLVSLVVAAPQIDIPDDNDACDVCKQTVKTIKDGLKSGILQQVLEIYLTKQCESLGIFAEVCKSAISKGIKFLSDQVQKMEPEETCRKIHLC
ncbi:hypothetical protein P879_03910 [Paragonimus westermani]|uniref:Saposin B-type domain-containing protein n=1 Tax=Paragonimus westermani TaxID=34504 RepID=A0A8T0DLI1_9TREM|nr:hypothetical protein P879_03910 [Paragonimus westermani]